MAVLYPFLADTEDRRAHPVIRIGEVRAPDCPMFAASLEGNRRSSAIYRM
jgi:hypothetical protein